MSIPVERRVLTLLQLMMDGNTLKHPEFGYEIGMSEDMLIGPISTFSIWQKEDLTHEKRKTIHQMYTLHDLYKLVEKYDLIFIPIGKDKK